MVKFSPSLMCMDILRVKETLDVLNRRANLLHVDIMDGHFVKNITLSPDFVKGIRPATDLEIDCHLMVTDPADYVEALAKAGATYICPQAETINSQAFRIINQIKSLGCKFGVVLNPATPLDYIKEYIHKVDKITIMSVDPGFAGQPFIPEMLHKVREAKRLKDENGYGYLIEIDGSCNERTFKDMYEAGVEVFIVGSSGLFNLDHDVDRAWDKMAATFKEKTGVEI
ncbi:D-allulose 6-phosphate 3-epimerase [Proteiniclasticum sp. QWL-01]|uniref:D-allulose 6-phosphate 3-epimerase n=1 Tax=Proteiniclasticum sp. QWL-01 TaxID=3036945 RepID=UPI002206AE04|nr:D-allulose 6-phosphate 3-epimerase [Proteiniclasticum sp. QWL-01]UUM12816.1 D-allulose 6-phosphate 3-epimerase [Clostridiaceae bacterium HFYG-1003]WFF74373.1 D-allulose 6-phosphate 3-epimerase [Proteiniclasticum sp. QWL-01]